VGKEIIITVKPSATVGVDITVEAAGFKDASCQDATEAFEKMLGKVAQREMKAEARRPRQVAHTVIASGK
jgi:hypothetical protein